MPGPDPDDRVHGAAALAGGATALITANLRHFDVVFFGDHGVIVETPESYLLRRLEDAPDRPIETVERVLATLERIVRAHRGRTVIGVTEGATVKASFIAFGKIDRKSTRLNSSHIQKSRMPSSA